MSCTRRITSSTQWWSVWSQSRPPNRNPHVNDKLFSILEEDPVVHSHGFRTNPKTYRVWNLQEPVTWTPNDGHVRFKLMGRSMHVCNWQGILTHESEVNVTTESRCGNRSSSRNSPWVRRNLQIHNISLEFRVRLQGSWSWMFVLISSTPVFTIQHSITSNGPSYELGPLPAGLDILPALFISEKWKGFVILER